jgi:polar amino acid transport system substrate-binding protein
MQRPSTFVISATFVNRIIRLAILCLAVASTLATAKPITIGMGNFEPYFIEKGQTGIFTDLVSAIFNEMPGLEPDYHFGYSNKRLWHEFSKKKLDAMANLFGSDKLKVCRSDPVFRFRDIIASKRIDQLTINTLADLEGKHVVTFQGARDFFGEAFKKHTQNGIYREVARPSMQAKTFLSNNAHVSVGDMFIFLASLKKLTPFTVTAKDFTFHDILPSIYSHMGFQDEKICHQFNAALKIIIGNGTYEKIYEGYLKQLSSPHS